MTTLACNKGSVPEPPMVIEYNGVCYNGENTIAPFYFNTDGETFSFIFYNYILQSGSGKKLYLSFRTIYSEPFELGKIYELPTGLTMQYVNLYYYDANGVLHDYYVKNGWLRFVMRPPELNGEFEFEAIDSINGTICHVTNGRFDLTRQIEGNEY